MATFSDTFTQGGQTQLHKFHMIRQVLGSTFKGGLAIFVATFGLFIWSLRPFTNNRQNQFLVTDIRHYEGLYLFSEHDSEL